MVKKKIVPVGLGCASLVICLLVVGTMWQLQGLSNTEDPDDYGFIAIKAPAQVAAGQPFSILVTARKNPVYIEDLTLHSIDFSNEYLAQAQLLEISPPATADLSIPLAGFQSYIFRQEIEQGDPTVIEFKLQAGPAEELDGLVDVCLNTASLCKRFELQTEVLAGD